MKRALLLALVALILASCGGAMSTPIPRSTATPALTPAPTPTTTPIPSPTSTSTPVTADSLSILRSAEENFRAETVFHVTVVLEDSDGPFTTKIDVLRPDTTRLIMDFSSDGEGALGEFIVAGESRFTLYPGFQGWFASSSTLLEDITDLGGFPYDLRGLLEAVQELEMAGEEVVEGEATHRLAGVVPVDFREEMTLPPGSDAPAMNIWVSRDDLLPRRIEFSIEDPRTNLRITYSDYGVQKTIRVPDDAIGSDYPDRLMNGDLSPEEIGQLVRILPVSGQQCMEEAAGTGLYNLMIAGEIGNNLLVWNAFRACVHRIFPFSFEGSDASGES